MEANSVYNFVYSVVRFFALIICVSEISGALDDNMLTVNVAADPNSDIHHWNTYSPDDVRCYCNLPVCVATSYMCKSETGVCFSELVDPEQSSLSRSGSQDVYKARHGCIELLQDKNQQSECRNMPNGKGASKPHPKSLLLCCSKDMCNHVDSPETQTMLNGTLLGPIFSENTQSSMSQFELNMSASPGYSSNEVWFKAAIIAVPICGTVILFVLIVLAVKILRTDSLSTSSKLGGHYVHGMDRDSNRDHFDHVHHHQNLNLKKVPLLPQHHHHHDVMSAACTNHNTDEIMKHSVIPLLLQNETGVSHSYDKKNETNAKLNSAQGHEYNLIINKELNSSPISILQKPTNVTSSNNIYKNVNLSLAPSSETLHHNTTTDKLYDKQALSAVVSWGATNGSCPV